MKRLFAVVGLVAFAAACSDSNMVAPSSQLRPTVASLVAGDPPPPPLSGSGGGFMDVGDDEIGFVANAAKPNNCSLSASFTLNYSFSFLQSNNGNNTVAHLTLTGPVTGSIDVHQNTNGSSTINGHISDGSFSFDIQGGDGTVGFDGFNFSLNGIITDLSSGQKCKTTGEASGSLVNAG